MKLEGLAEDTDRVFHGLGVFERSAKDLTIFAINHRRGGSVIEVLEYTIGDTVVKYKETLRHPLIVTPNDIVAMGERFFYVSNDHRHPTGHMREIEGKTSCISFFFPLSLTVVFAFEGTLHAKL